MQIFYIKNFGLAVILSISLGCDNSFASSSHTCLFQAKVTGFNTSPENEVQLEFKVQRRTFGTWIIGYSFCKELVGTNAITGQFIPQYFPVILEVGTMFKVKGTKICSENGNDFNFSIHWLPAE